MVRTSYTGLVSFSGWKFHPENYVELPYLLQLRASGVVPILLSTDIEAEPREPD